MLVCGTIILSLRAMGFSSKSMDLDSAVLDLGFPPTVY